MKTDSMDRWYVAQTHSQSEFQALAHLVRQGFSAYLPQYLKRRRHARRTDSVRRPLFPGYLFVRMDVERIRWRAIRSTIGIRTLICNGERPVAVPEGVVEDIRTREDENGTVPVHQPPPFDKGETVRINHGAICDRVGLFDCVSDEERVFVLLDLLGRQLRLRVPATAVTAFV